MSLVVRTILSIYAIACHLNACSKDLNILVVEQSMSSDCTKLVHGNAAETFQVNRSGNTKLPSYPLNRADCRHNLIWLSLGRKIVSTGYATTVTFLPIGIRGTSINDWLPGEKEYPKLKKIIETANTTSIRFDFAFWHQDSSGTDAPPDQYLKSFKAILQFISTSIRIDKWLIAQHTNCERALNSEISKVQKIVTRDHITRRFPGPNSNSLDKQYRDDDCQLNVRGQEEMASLWLESMISADRLDYMIQKETLISYFRGLAR